MIALFMRAAGPYLAAAAVGALVGGWMAYYPAKWIGHREGRAALIAEQRLEGARRSREANDAENKLRDCIARDPACLLRDDGHRRD